jgi:hypothetical protein
VKTPALVRLFEQDHIVFGVLLVNAVLGARLFFDPGIFSASPVLIFSMGFLAASGTVFFFRRNIVYQSRIVLLVVIGYYAGLIKTIDPDAAFSPLGTDIQTLDIGVKMFGLTSIALFGAAIGLLAGGRELVRPSSSGWEGLRFPYPAWQALFYFATAIVIVAGILSARSYGPSVFEAVYATEGAGQGQLLGNLQSLGVICLVIASVAGLHLRGRWVRPFLAALVVYFLGWGIFIRGGRLEVLAGILALVAALPAATGKVARLRWYHYVGVVLLAIFMEAWGSLRTTLSVDHIDSETGDSILLGYQALQEVGVYHAGTISAIGSTFANTLDMVDTHVIPYAHGGTYFDYLLRSPPEFLYPGRPTDLAWIFEEYGYKAAGGFFELAEAYLNFGILGCLIIPFCISYVLATFYRKALHGGFFPFVLFVSMLSVFFRGAWYQTFAFYKAILTGMILYVGFWIVSQLVSGGRKATWSRKQTTLLP